MIKIQANSWFIPILLILGTLILPLTVAYHHIGDRIIFNFLAGDSMYYMSIANNYTKYGFPTMDGVAATNGFHPLWEYTLMLLFKFTGISHHNQIYMVFGLSIALVCATYAIFSRLLIHLGGKWPGIIATLFLIPGMYSLLLEPKRHSFGEPGVTYGQSPLSAMNGMETPLSLFLMACFTASLIRRYRYQMEKDGKINDMSALFPMSARLLIGAIILSRLDDIAYAGAIGLWILFSRGSVFSQRIKLCLRVFWPAASMLGCYALYNHFTVGLVMPISASMKMHQTDTSRLLEPFGIVLSGHQWGIFEWWLAANRVLPMVYALGCGIIFLFWTWYHRYNSSDRCILDGLLVPAGIYLVAKTVLLTMSIDTFGQGYWYYFTLVTTSNLILAIFFLHLLKNNPQIIRAAGTFLFVITFFTMPNTISYASVTRFSEANFNYMPKNEGIDSNSNYNEVAYNLWMYSDIIKADLHSRYPNDMLIDNIDGVFGYLLDMPAEALTGLALSKQALEDRESKGMLVSPVSRGYKIIPAYGYADPRNFPDQVTVIETIRPAFSPINFFRLDLPHPKAEGKP